MEVSPPRYFRPLRPRDQAPACFRPVVSTTTCTLALWAGDRPLGSLCTRPHRPNGFISSPILVENLRLVFYQIFPFWCMHGQRTPHLCFTINASPGLCYAMGHQRSSLGSIPEAPTPGPCAYKMVKKHKTRLCSAILACSGACGVACWRSPTRSSITTPLPNQLATIVAIPPSSNSAAWHK